MLLWPLMGAWFGPFVSDAHTSGNLFVALNTRKKAQIIMMNATTATTARAMTATMATTATTAMTATTATTATTVTTTKIEITTVAAGLKTFSPYYRAKND